MKRPHFSMRALLVAIMVLSAVSYLLFVRPTIIANSFIAAMESGDYEAAEALLTGAQDYPFRSHFRDVHNPTVTGKLSPQRISDLVKLQRNLRVQFKPDLIDEKPQAGVQIETVSTIWGIGPSLKVYQLTFTP